MFPQLILDPDTQLVTVEDSSPSISVIWDRAIQQAVINTAVGPTIGSRAYSIVHTAMFDAWAAYDETAISTQLGDSLQRPQTENTEANKTEAMSFAAYRVIAELFPDQVDVIDATMTSLGFDTANATTDTTTPAGIGNVSAEALMSDRRNDGSNQTNGYTDTTGYTSANTSDNITTIDRWTAERVPINSPNANIQSFLTPQWGTVDGFSIDSPEPFRPAVPQPFLLVDGATVSLADKTITLVDGTVLDITPDLVGSIINPEFIAQAENVVNFSANLTDSQKLVAEFWEDGGGTSFPPGTWMTFGQFVSARDNNTLDADAKLFFTLSNAVLDAGIATWEAKTFYDYVRPVRAIRELGKLGLIGEFNAELGGYTIEAWAGPGQGTQTILATDFTTYQTPGSDPSPPFSEYTSGHSAFSAAGAAVLELISGSNQFGGSVTFDPGDSRFEPGLTPGETTTLDWNTFTTAADEAGLSRLYGGIHFTEGDVNGRTLGDSIGTNVFAAAQGLITGRQNNNFLIGTVNNETLNGTQRRDYMYGRSGNDILKGNRGQDSIFGGDGNDKLIGGNGKDSLRGNAGDDKLFGGNGQDTLAGDRGNDILAGGLGADVLSGGLGDDVLKGGNGTDILRGGLGNDILKGGAGRDTFVLAIEEGSDLITDFEVNKDLIGLAGGLTFGQLTFENKHIIAGEKVLATLNNVFTTQLSEASFVTV